ncbi:Hsp33 family molecular chaperone HslO [Pseudoxanthomonas sacheonensis]|uniref:Hsp33 family molecular chaperone HslO n=1 Tax=Pseudoxanthomonas sacheonensis TaxID=443615 RepID=UPI0013D183D3|nr:heat-shock protein Hsp33 [Pseudoxanthomonas sacheonensis]
MSDTYDRQTRFLLPKAGVRGVCVRLEGAWRDILSHADYPEAARELLGQSCAAAALFTGHAKVNGRLSLQLRSPGALRTLFAECTAQGTLRGIAKVAEGQDPPHDLRELGEEALLAITIENPGLDPREPQRYQSLVSLQAAGLSEAFENYFHLSEQLPTRLLLAADGKTAAGLMLQKLPGDEGDSDGWNRAGALFETLQSGELLAVPVEELLHRLFHEEELAVLAERPLRFACSCSQQRVAAMLQSLGAEEAHAALADDQAEVRCEFCGQRYIFSAREIDELFDLPPVGIRAPEWLQ